MILAYLCVYEVHESCNSSKIQSWMDASLVDRMCVWLALGFGLGVCYGRMTMKLVVRLSVCLSVCVCVCVCVCVYLRLII